MNRLALLALLTASPALAQEVPGDPAAGAALYERYCATCHGADARGDGPMASILLIQPTDLTQLAERYGTLPIARIVRRIDGRDPLVSHGSPMPVWGDFFEGEDTALKAETGQPILTSRPIVDLVAWLETVQE